MSLLPLLFDDSYSVRPSRILDQHFGLGLAPDTLFQGLVNPRMLIQCPAGYLRNWISDAAAQDTGSSVSFDNDKFQANIDVQQFKPEEITVKITGENAVTVEGKHEEKKDEHGSVSRHFVRRYVLPKSCDINLVQSKLSSDGVLTITAPKVGEDPSIEHKRIPITQTGQPARKIEHKKDEPKN